MEWKNFSEEKHKRQEEPQYRKGPTVTFWLSILQKKNE